MQGLRIINETSVPTEVLADYREANLRLPLSALPARSSRKLAVVGSGPSIRKHFQEIVDFEGDLWAINGAWRWLRDHGVEATFFSIDPLPVVEEFSRGAKEVILASECDPRVFAARMFDGADVVRLEEAALGGFSATGALVTALAVGYEETTLFGCECSFDSPKVHVDGRELNEDYVEIGVGEESFITRIPYYQQALHLSCFIGNHPGKFVERSGGLLASLVACFQLDGLKPEMPWVDEIPIVADAKSAFPTEASQ